MTGALWPKGWSAPERALGPALGGLLEEVEDALRQVRQRARVLGLPGVRGDWFAPRPRPQVFADANAEPVQTRRLLASMNSIDPSAELAAAALRRLLDLAQRSVLLQRHLRSRCLLCGAELWPRHGPRHGTNPGDCPGLVVPVGFVF